MMLIPSIIALVLALGFFVWLIYAIKADPSIATYSIGFNTQKVEVNTLLSGAYGEKLSRMGEYAELCQIVYREDNTKNKNRFKNWYQLLIPMENTEPEVEGKTVIEGLYYELWELPEEDKTTVAIVFRGTHKSSDWIANRRWFIRFFSKKNWDHYDQLNKISESIITSIKSKYPENKKLEIISTGHSLGGGLAQFMAYATPEVKHVFAFDPSPVTAYYDVRPKSRRNENKKGVVIYRIFESGEALSPVRKLMTLLYPTPLLKQKDPQFVIIRFSFKTGTNSIEQHSIQVLATHLNKNKQEGNPEA